MKRSDSMKAKLLGDTYAVRLDKGEEIFSSLLRFCEENEIRVGIVNGIGTADDTVMGVYDLENKAFCPERYTYFMEISALSGNVSTMNGKTYLHLHITAAGKDGVTRAGHLQSATVGATAEIFIRKLDGELSRVYDEETGLNIFEV